MRICTVSLTAIISARSEDSSDEEFGYESGDVDVEDENMSNEDEESGSEEGYEYVQDGDRARR